MIVPKGDHLMTANQFRLFVAIAVVVAALGYVAWLAYQPVRRVNECAALRESFGYSDARAYCADLQRQGLLARD